ncbi:membrane protein insertion efficiency factor YidD [Scytonema sp. UIC 10036]|uniref:membrane protein insertion efficiency factor YidD n=1 Tax=Scytonema sp. UIC 10036 TaxID=2304196 RepID=UPI0012DAF65B|nr:membrane protein insertion efficiency factor YidD [Scytonema sp. UIC 10036]MUG91927.1 membrane protein insertion efficiency factor YidD [Scytonema sp. UIC 10036]
MQVSVFDSVSRQISVAAITQYQKRISPHKGFSCAHRILYGGESCSQYIKRVIAQEGLRGAMVKSRIRFQACSQANEILRAQIEGSTEETPDKKHRRHNCTKDKVRQSDCRSSDCGGGCDCIEGLVDLATCDCTVLDCSALDCSAADCGSLDCGSCGSCGS